MPNRWRSNVSLVNKWWYSLSMRLKLSLLIQVGLIVVLSKSLEYP
jgi:hypothetical protein